MRVDAQALGILGHAVGRRIAVEQADAGRRLADRDDLETQARIPVVIFGDQTGLIAGRHRVNHTRGLSHLVEDGTHHNVGLDVEHHDVLAREDRAHGDTGADVGVAGCLDDDVDREFGEDLGVLGGDRLAGPDRVRSGRRVGHHHILARMAAEFEGAHHPFGADIGDDGIPDAFHQADLADGAGAHAACADKADLDGPALLGPTVECLLEHPTPAFIFKCLTL